MTKKQTLLAALGLLLALIILAFSLMAVKRTEARGQNGCQECTKWEWVCVNYWYHWCVDWDLQCTQWGNSCATPSPTPTLSPTPRPSDSPEPSESPEPSKTPEPTPQPQPCHNCAKIDVEPYSAAVCNGVQLTPPTAVGGFLDGSQIVFKWYPSTDDGIDHQIVEYGYEPDQLIYSIVNVDPQLNELRPEGLDNTRHVWFKVTAERDYCQASSQIVDP